MAHNIEPMDIDNIDSDFDNKENNFHHNNVQPSTEKGYEELDVSELNMKLRYSITPASSPMSKSYTANCLDNRNIETADDSLNALDNANLTRSFNSMMTKTENNSKSIKIAPLQLHHIEQTLDNNRNNSVLRPLDTTLITDGNNITVTITQTNDNDIDEGLFPSSSSSTVHTPEAITPTKEAARNDGGSPIMRGLKTVLNMFRSSQSPIPPSESEGKCAKHDISSPADLSSPNSSSGIPSVALASTPIAAHKNREATPSKRNSPLKESVVFNDDLEKELLWKDETTILFSQEKIPIHKLFFQNSKPVPSLQSKDSNKNIPNLDLNESLNTSVEYMDVSYNDSIKNKTITDNAGDLQNNNIVESDSEFVDCETTFTNQSGTLDDCNPIDQALLKPFDSRDISPSKVTVNTVSEEVIATNNLTQDLGPVPHPELESVITNSEPLDITKTIEKAASSSSTFTKEDIQCLTQNVELDATVTIGPVEQSRVSATFVMESQNSTMSVESSTMPLTSSTFVKECAPDVISTTVTIEQDEKPLLSETFVKDVKGTALPVESDCKALTSSTFVKDIAQDIFNGTVTIDQGEKSLSSETFVKDIQNATVCIESSNKPITSSTFIKDVTQDAFNETVVLDQGDKSIVSATFVEDSQNTEKKINAIVAKLDATRTIDDCVKPLLPTTLVTDIQTVEASQKAEEAVDENSVTIKNTQEIATVSTHIPREILDYTVTTNVVDKSTISASFMNNIKGETFKIDPAETSTEIKELRNETEIIEQNDNLLITACINDGENETNCKIDFSNDNLNLGNAVESAVKSNTAITGNNQTNESRSVTNMSAFANDAEKEANCNVDLSNDNLNLDNEIESAHKPNTAMTDNEQTNESLHVTNIDINIRSESAIDLEAESGIIENSAVEKQTCHSQIDIKEESLNINIHKEIENRSEESSIVNSDSLVNKTVECINENSKAAEEPTEILVPPVEYHPFADEFQNKDVQNINKDATIIQYVSSTDIVKKAAHQLDIKDLPSISGKQIELYIGATVSMVELDILKSSESNNISEANEVDVNPEQITENIIDLASHPTISDLGNLPADIPLPDEDDLEIEATSNECSNEENISINLILPDIINVYPLPNAADANEVDKVPMNTLSQAKPTADLINDTLLDKETTIQIDEHNSLNLPTEVNLVNPNEANSPIVGVEMTEAEPSTTNDEIFSPLVINLVTEKNNSLEKFKVVEEITINNIDRKSQDVESMDINESVQEIPKVADIVHEVHKENIDEKPQVNKTETQNNEEQEISTAELSIQNNDNNVNFPSPNISIEQMEIDITIELNEIEKKDEIQQSSVTAIMENVKEDNIHEEIIISENSSPYVLVSVDKQADARQEEDFEKIEKPLMPELKKSPSPPISPKIVSKGYNFNFDEIEDPFATKTKIRLSPPLDSPNHSIQLEKKNEISNKNRRKSQPERKKPLHPKKSANKTFDAGVCLNETVVNKQELSNIKAQDHVITDLNAANELPVNTLADSCPKDSLAKMEDNEILHEKDKSELEINVDNTSKLENVIAENQSKAVTGSGNMSATSSSLEQSTYYSATTSSSDSIVTKNVFNLPEIDDINFNPFATKSKMRQSPLPAALRDDFLVTSPNPNFDATEVKESDITKAKNIMTLSIEAAQSSSQNNKSYVEENASCNTSSSKVTDVRELTVREVHTDDDDTVEGPFLEVDDLDDEKIAEFTSQRDDLLQFTDLPAPENEENELFIDAEAFEFLLNQNKSNVVTDSGKESLFLKFDPLFAKRMSSDGVAAALSRIQKRQSTPKKTPKKPQTNVKNVEKPIAGTSTSNVTLEQSTIDEHVDDLNATTSKPMMVVTPAVNPAIAPRKCSTPANSNRRSITFTSPAIAVIDRLLSLSANNSLVAQDTPMTQVSREQTEADLVLTQLRELLAEKEINVYNLKSESKELKDRLTTMESQMKSLEAESEERLKKVNELNEKLSEKSKLNKSMAAVVEEYERTIASLIAETEQDKKRHNEERMQLMKERDEQTAHLASMEVSFSDLHSKYEKSKQIILSCKANEDTYKKSIKEFEENLSKMQNNYELLKQHATSKLNHANQELEKMNRAHESEVLKLNAMIKRKELHITSLEETLTQKTKANEELTAICDELINKVG